MIANNYGIPKSLLKCITGHETPSYLMMPNPCWNAKQAVLMMQNR